MTTWTPAARARLRAALAHVERRILEMPGDLSGNAVLHVQHGVVRRLEFRLIETVDREPGAEP